MKKVDLKFAFLFSLGISLLGCQTSETTPRTTNELIITTNGIVIEEVPVIRYGRYTFVEINQVDDSQDLLSKIIEVSIPLSFTKQKLTVKDGLNYVLLGSGYNLCQTSAVNKLSQLPLPAYHHHLGPMTLSSALKVLAGPTWQMQVDQHNRLICFNPNPDVKVTIDSSNDGDKTL